MTVQAYLDGNGNVKHRELSDRKKCLSRQEFFKIVNETPLKNHVYMTGQTCIDGNFYHVVYFNHWAGFTLVLAELNSMYGRGIETILNQEEYPSCQLLIRAYKK